jgi:hypothetical protein
VACVLVERRGQAQLPTTLSAAEQQPSRHLSAVKSCPAKPASPIPYPSRALPAPVQSPAAACVLPLRSEFDFNANMEISSLVSIEKEVIPLDRPVVTRSELTPGVEFWMVKVSLHMIWLDAFVSACKTTLPLCHAFACPDVTCWLGCGSLLCGVQVEEQMRASLHTLTKKAMAVGCLYASIRCHPRDTAAACNRVIV